MNHTNYLKHVLMLMFGIFISSSLMASEDAITGSIKGTVTTSDGKAASNISVGLKNEGKLVITKEDGSFLFRNIQPGNYILEISSLGLVSQERSVTVKAGDTTTVDFTLTESLARLDEVVITGYRTPNIQPVTLGKIGIAPKDLPQSVQIIGSAVIADQQVNRLSDVLKNVNGVVMGENRGSVNETFFARGYNLGANNIFKNGSRANSGGLPETSTLESVEVLKGSAALLYGGVTGGAVINMVTKKPQFNVGGEVSVRTGSYDLYKPTVDVYGPITRKVAFRVITTKENAKSFRNMVRAKRLYVNPSLLYNINKNTELIVQGDYLKSDYTPDFGIGTVNNKIINIGRDAFLNTVWAYNKTATATSQVNLNHGFNDDWKLNILTSLQSFKRNYYSAERPFADVNGIAARNLTRSKNKEYTYNQQINLNGNFNTGSFKHTLLAGADADESRVTAYGFKYDNNATTYSYGNINLLDPATYNTRTDMPGTTIISDTFTPVYRMGAFVQDLVGLTQKFKLLGGVRYTFQKTPRTLTYNYETGITTLSNNSINKSKIEKVFSPKFALIYQPIPASSVYVSYASNFTSNTGTDIYLSPLDPSRIDQYELGIKNDFLKGRLSVNITGYRILNDRFAQTALFKADGTINSDATLKEFSGSTTSDGLEVDITGTVSKELHFLAGYSYNFYRYTKTLDKTGIVEGERIIGSAKNTANATVFYTFSAKGLKLGASGFYTGRRNGGYNTLKTPNATRVLIPLNGFTTFDLVAGYAFKKFSVLGKVSNLTNELNYYVHENYSVNPIAPRQFITTLAYKF